MLLPRPIDYSSFMPESFLAANDSFIRSLTRTLRFAVTINFWCHSKDHRRYFTLYRIVNLPSSFYCINPDTFLHGDWYDLHYFKYGAVNLGKFAKHNYTSFFSMSRIGPILRFPIRLFRKPFPEQTRPFLNFSHWQGAVCQLCSFQGVG